MNSNMVLGQYYNTNSLIHKLDPRTKIIGLIMLMVSLFLVDVDSLLVLGLFTGLIFVLIILSNIKFSRFIKSMKHVIYLLVFSFIFQILFIKSGDLVYELTHKLNVINIACSTILLLLYFLFRRKLKLNIVIFILVIVGVFYLLTYDFTLGYFYKYQIKIYSDGIINGAFIGWRIFMLISLSTLLTLSTKPTDMTMAIEWLLKPLELFKVKTSIFAMLISIALRSIPTLFNETQKVLKAQASRGVDFKEGKLKDQIVQIVSLLIPMFFISFKRAEELAYAMSARAYIPGDKRTSINVIKFSLKDYIAHFILLAILVLMILYKVL